MITLSDNAALRGRLPDGPRGSLSGRAELGIRMSDPRWDANQPY